MNSYLNSNYQNLKKISSDYKKKYKEASPFPNITFGNFFNSNILNEILNEFPDIIKGDDTLTFNKSTEYKIATVGEALLRKETKKLIHYLNSEPFLNFLQDLTGIKETIIPDPYLSGGGLHETKKGGLLKIHTDFNKHPKTNLDRRINVLIYLNKDWKDEYGGHFEMWDRYMKNCINKISPDFNSLTIFSTNDFSYHGHPDPLNCPAERSRKSIALYYYTNGRPNSELDLENKSFGTIFKERKNNKVDKYAFEKKTLFRRIKRLFDY